MLRIKLAIKEFKEHNITLIKIHVKPGSIIVTWLVPAGSLSRDITRSTREHCCVERGGSGRSVHNWREECDPLHSGLHCNCNHVG